MNTDLGIGNQRLVGRVFSQARFGELARRVSGTALVDLWLVQVTEDGPLGLKSARALLDGTAARMASRRPRDDRHRSLVARAALVRLVAARTGADTAEVSIGHTERGRPVLLDGSGLHVSLAHSGDFVACAVSDRPVGVDIERSDRPEADDGLAARVCTPVELQQLARSSLNSRQRALVRLWARKEAVSKALGRGFATPFDHIDVIADRPLIAGLREAALWVRDVGGGPDGYMTAIAGDGRRCSCRASLFAEESVSRLDVVGGTARQ